MMDFKEEFDLYNSKHDEWYSEKSECWVWVKKNSCKVGFYKTLSEVLEQAKYNGDKIVFAEKIQRPQQLLLMPLERCVV